MIKCMLMFFILAWPVSAAADIADYDLDNTEWMGMSELRGIAESQGVELEPASTLDFKELDLEEPLIIVYPTKELDSESLASFVIDGGRILLMDDFGHADSLLKRLEVTRVMPSPGNLPHDTFLRGNPSLPILRPSGRHPLLEGVFTLVANHPAVLDNPGGAVIPYSAGGALVFDMNLGKGKVIVVADASVGINKMVGVADNRRFLSNAVAYACGTQSPCVAKFLTKDFATVGRYADSGLFEGGEEMDNAVSTINETIEELLEKLPGSELLYYLSLLLAGGLAIYVFTIFPIRRTRPYSAYVTDFVDAVPAPQSEFDWNVSRFGRGSRTMNHALPMAILKEAFEELFLGELGLWPSSTKERESIDHLVALFAKSHLGQMTPAARKKLLSETKELLVVLATIPTRSRVFLEGDVSISDAELLKYHTRAMRVLNLMGLKNEYDDRVRGAF